MSPLASIRSARLFLPLVLLLTSGACVKKSTHQATLGALAAEQGTTAALRARLVERDAELEGARTRISELEREIAALEARRAEAESRFEEARGEVHRLELLLGERGEEYRRLQQRIQALSALEREVRERNRIYEEVLGRFRAMIDGGQVSVAIVRGRMVIQLPQDILFASGSATLGAEGRRTLTEVGTVLAGLDDRSFQVEGHTDNVPIATERFPSNWDLSSARALSVVQVLVDAGVRAQQLSGAGYGEFHPVASNDDRDGRRLNRRIEIVMLPNLDVIAEAELPR